MGWLNTYFLPFITLKTSSRVSSSPLLRMMPSQWACRASTHNCSLSISPVKMSTFTSLCSAFSFLQISTPMVVLPPSPRSSSTRSGLLEAKTSQNESSELAVAIISASGTSLCRRPSVPFSSSSTSSTIITLNFSIYLALYKLLLLTFLLLCALSPRRNRVHGNTRPCRA